jgi:DNA-binding response OmpR family regulator
MRVLVVEDQLDLSSFIAERLEHSGYVVDRVGTLADAIEAVRTHDYPVMLLDRRLPDGDGVAILPEVRAARPGIRVLVVTALRSIDDRIDGLDAGADDYLTKPFDPNELLARIRASLRRPGSAVLPRVIVGAISFDLNNSEALIEDRPFMAPRREMLLLEALMRRAGRMVVHAVLMDEIYGFNQRIQIDALKMLVSRLRQRLRENGAGVEIHSARGIGYLIAKSRP